MPGLFDTEIHLCCWVAGMGLGQYHRSSACRVSVDGFSSTLSEPGKEVTVVWRLSLHGAVLGLTSAKIHMR